ncbi:MAG: trehalase family glycosidase [Planctomycetaceae bacterium]
MKQPNVHLTLYRYAGRFLFLRIHKRCEACDVTYAVLNRLMADVFAGKPVKLRVAPWLDRWWKPLLRGGWHAPILLLDGKMFSQGSVPDVPALIRAVAARLGDEGLAVRADEYAKRKRPTATRDEDLVVYGSPACPHCRDLVRYLEVNDVRFVLRDVSSSPTAREELRTRTGSFQIPIVCKGDRWISGTDRAALCELANIDGDREPSATDAAEAVIGIDAEQLASAAEQARRVLRGNQFDGRTRASRRLYPHQWNWDTGFIARGYLHFDAEQAYREIRSLFAAQWSDGFLPHIVFSPNARNHFPGPDYWRAERSRRVPDGVLTSGISQPPVHATMIAAALELDPDRERAARFLAVVYPKLKSLHDFFFAHRDPRREGLVTVVHPWESGIDNAPLWDEALARITSTSPWSQQMQTQYDELAHRGERPPRTYIAKYSYIVENLFRHDYDWAAILSDHPFQVQDILFNAMLCRAERDLATIAAAIGADPAPHRERAGQVARAMNAKLWNDAEQTYDSFDVVSGRHLRRETVFSYIPLYAGCCDADKAARVVARLRTRCFCMADRNCVAVPSYDMCQADYDGEFYWRGPVWFNINWMLAKGLRRHGQQEQADWIETSLLRLAIRRGFYEYYSPETGEGLGASDFSWTAALFLDLAANRNAAKPANDREPQTDHIE